MKRPWQSRTNWVNFLLAAAVLSVPGAEDFITQHPRYCAVFNLLVAIALRSMTSQPIEAPLWLRWWWKRKSGSNVQL